VDKKKLQRRGISTPHDIAKEVPTPSKMDHFYHINLKYQNGYIGTLLSYSTCNTLLIKKDFEFCICAYETKV
jgi:hypothetical protein